MAKKKEPIQPQVDWANLPQEQASEFIKNGFSTSSNSVFDRPIGFSETFYGLDIDKYDGLIGERSGGEGFITANPEEWQDLAAQNQSGAIQALKAVPRIVTGTGLKLLQGTAMLGSAIGVLGRELGREAIEGTGQVDISDITDNAVVNALFKAEDVIKNSEGFAIFKPSDWDDRSIWEQLGSTAWWADEFADGAAFALQSAIGAGAIGKLGLGSRVASRLGSVGRQAEAFEGLAKRALGLGAKNGTMGAPSSGMQRLIQSMGTGNVPMQIGQYTDFLSQVGILTAQESLFEARDTGHQVQQRLLEEAGHNVAGLTPEEQLEYLNSLPEEEQQEIKRKKGQAMQNTFLANMAAISFSNMVEVAGLNRLMGQGLRKFMGSANKAARRGIDLGEDLYSQASVIERKGIQRYIGRGSRPRTIAGVAAGQALSEGLYEENIQNSIQNISEHFDGGGIVDYVGDVVEDMVSNTFSGDNETWKSIVTGAMLGGLMGVGAGTRNYRDNQAARLAAIEKINQAKANLVNIKDNIYERDSDGNIIMEEGRPKYDADAIMNLVANQTKAQDLADLHDLYEEAGNKEIASVLWNDAITDISLSYLEAGFGDQLLDKIKALGNVKEQDLQNEGLETQSTDENGRTINVQERAARMLEVAQNVKNDYEAITSVIPDNEFNTLRINSAVRIASRLRKLNEKRGEAETKYNEILGRLGLNPVVDINSTIDKIDALKEIHKAIEKDSPVAAQELQKQINSLTEEVNTKKESNRSTLTEQGITVPSGLGKLVDINPNTPDKIALRKQASKVSEYDGAIQQQLEKYNDLLTNPKKFQEGLNSKLDEKAREEDEKLEVANTSQDLQPGQLVELTDKKTGAKTIVPVQISPNGETIINGIDINSNINAVYSSIRPLNEQERQEYIDTQAYAYRVSQLNNRIQEIRNDIERLNNEQEKEVENLIKAEDSLASLQSQRLTKKSRVSEKILNDRIVATENLIRKTQEAIGKYDDLIAERERRIDEIEFTISERDVPNIDSLRQELDLVREEYKNTQAERKEAQTLLDKLKDYYDFLKEYWQKIFPNKKRVFEDFEDAQAVEGTEEFVRMRARVNEGIRTQWNDPQTMASQEEAFIVSEVDKALKTGQEYSDFKRDLDNTRDELKQREEAVKELDKRLRGLKRRGELIAGEIRQYENFLAQLTNPGVFNPVKGQEENESNFPTVNGSYTPLDSKDFRAKKNIADGLFTTTGNSTLDTPSMNRWFKFTEQVRPSSNTKLLAVTINHPQFGVGKEFDVYREEPEAFRTKDNIKVIALESYSDPLGPGGVRPLRIDGEIVSTSLIEITPNKTTIGDFKLRDGDTMFHNRDGLTDKQISEIIEDYRTWTDEIKNNPTKKHLIPVTGKSLGFIEEGPEISANEAFGINTPTLHINTRKQVELAGQRYGVEVGMGYVNYNGRPVPTKARKINQEEAEALLKAFKAYGKIRNTISGDQTAKLKARGRDILDKIRSIVFLGKSSNPEYSTYFVKGERNFAFGNNVISIFDLVDGKFDQELIEHFTNLNHQISFTHLKRPSDEAYVSITGERYNNYSDYLMNPDSNNRQNFQVPVKFAIIPRTEDTNTRQINGMYLYLGEQVKKSTVEKQPQVKTTPAQTEGVDLNSLSYTSLSDTLSAVSEEQAQAEEQTPSKKEPTQEELSEVSDMMISMLGPNPQEITMDNGHTYLVGIVDGNGLILRKDDTSKLISGTSPLGKSILDKVNWEDIGEESSRLEDVVEQQPESTEDIGVFGQFNFEGLEENSEQGENRVIETQTEETFPEDDVYSQLNSSFEVVQPTEQERLEALNLGENPPSESDIENSADKEGPFMLASQIKDYNQANISKEIIELEKLVGSKALAGIVRGLIKGKAFGQTLSDGRILLSDIMTEGTAYHEAFHRIFSGIISESERNKVLQDWRNRNPNVQYSDFQIEEELAEEFREYMLTKQHEHKPTESIFRRIWNYLRALLRIPSAVKDRLFYKISKGTYVDVSPKRTIVGNKFQQAPEGFSAVREEYGTVTERSLYEGLTYGFLEGLVGNNFNVDDVLNFNDGTLSVTDNVRYQTIFNNTFESAMNLMSKNPSLAEQVKFFRDNKKNIFDNFSNYLQRYGITLKEEQENEVIPNEEGKGKDTLGIIESIEFNVKSGVPNSVKLMIASLPELTRNNRFRPNQLGLPRLSNYKTNLAKLHNALAGLETIQEMRDKVVELSSERPEFKILLKRLGIPMSGPVTTTGMNEQTVKLQTQFKQQFDKANYTAYVQLLDADGNSFFVNANSERASDLIKQQWRTNFRSLPKNRLKLVEGRYVYNPSYFEKTYKGKLTRPDQILSFYKDLGIIFSDEESVDVENVLEPLAGHFYNAVQKGTVDNLFDRSQADLSGWINDLVKEELKGNFDATDNQHINSDSKTVYSINLNNYLTIATKKINKGEADYLTWDEATTSGNPLTRKSHFLNLGYKIDVVNLDGTRLRESESGRDGNITAKLSRGESLSQQFVAVMNGIFPFIRQGDRKIEYGITLNHSNGTRVGLRGLKAETIDSTTEIFKGYLADEILSAWMLVNDDVGSDIPVYNQAGRELRFFKNVFNKTTEERIQNLIDNNKLDRKAVISRIDSIINDEAVVSGIQNLLETKTEQFFQEFIDSGVITERGGRYINQGLSSEIVGNESSYTKEELLDPIQRFTYNYLIGNIEQSKLFTGDVAFYKLKSNKAPGGQVISTSHDFFKRTSGLGGTGKTLRNDSEYNEWLQENKSRPDKAIINGKIQTWVFDDVEAGSSLKRNYFKALTERFGFTAKEANDLLSGYDRYDEADAQGLITLPEYREFLTRSGDWTQSQEIVYQKIQNQEALTASDVLTLPPLKPQYFGPQTYKDLYVPTFYKLSLMPLIPSVIGENSTLGKLNQDMLSNGVGIVTYTSGNKVGKLTGQPLYNEQGEYNTESKVIQELDYDFMKIQLDMSPEKHHKVTFGTQFRKLILSNLIGNRLSGSIEKFINKGKDTAKGVSGESIIGRYNNLVHKQVELELIDVLKRLKATVNKDGSINISKAKLANLLTDEAFKRSAPNNVIDDINEALGKERGIEIMVTRPKIESILMSIMDNTVIHNKVLGDMLVQASSTGFETKPRNLLQTDIKDKPWASDLSTLKFYEYGPNGTSAMEVYLPHRFKELYGQDVNIEDIDPRLLELVGFRIPTQGLNSMEAIKIKGFLPQEAGNTIILPSEIVAKAGSDFDIDKLTIFLPNYNVTRNWNDLITDMVLANSNQRLGLDPKWFTQKNLETLENEYNNGIRLSGQDSMVFNLMRDTIRNNPNRYRTEIEYAKYDAKNPTKKGVQNELINITRAILLAPENFPSLIAPISSEALQAEARMMRSLKPSLIEEKGRESYFDLDFIMETREAYLTGKDGVGIAASNLTHHVLSQIAGLRIAPNSTTINLPHNNTDGRIDLSKTRDIQNEETGNTKAPTILDNISAFLNGFVDIAKDPFLKTINADTETAGTYLYLIRAGVPLRHAVLFMNQPIILDYLKNFKLGRNLYRKARGEEKSYKDIKNETLTNYGSEVFDLTDTEEREKYLNLLSESNMKKAIKGELPTEEYNRMQQQILEDYLSYQDAGKKLLELSRATNSDTRGTGPSMESASDLLERFESIKREGYFENVDKFETQTVIGVFNSAIDTTIKSYRSVFPILQREDVREIMGNIKDTLRLNRFVSQDVIDRTLKTAENDFIGFLFQNSSYQRGYKRGNLIAKYFTGENSLPKQIARIKGSNDPLRNNLLIQELYPILSSSENVQELSTDFDNLKFFSRRIIKEHADDLSYAWEELFNQQPNLANQLFTFAVLQSSFNNSPLEFLKYAPPKFTSQALQDYIENDTMISDINFDDFFYKFLRNNWRNSDLIPYTLRGRMLGREYRSFLSTDWSTISTTERFKNYHYVKTSVKRQDGSTRYLLFENTYETRKDKGKEYPIFKRVGLLGNGYFFKEYATDVSIITDNRAPNDVIEDLPVTNSIVSYVKDLKKEIMESTLSESEKGRYLQLTEAAETIEQIAAIREQICK